MLTSHHEIINTCTVASGLFRKGVQRTQCIHQSKSGDWKQTSTYQGHIEHAPYTLIENGSDHNIEFS